MTGGTNRRLVTVEAEIGTLHSICDKLRRRIKEIEATIAENETEAEFQRTRILDRVEDVKSEIETEIRSDRSGGQY